MIVQELYTRPEEVTEYLYQRLSQNASMLGLEYVGAYGEIMIPGYPAVIINASDADKELHGTHTYLVTLRCELYIYHGSINLTRAKRSLEDLKLATAIVEFIEEDLTLGGKIIHGYISTESPAAAQTGGGGKSDIVVSTRINWEGITERRF